MLVVLDSLDELATSFENISYPSLPPSLTGPMANSFGFACSAPTSDVPAVPATNGEKEEECSLVEGFSMVQVPTPVLSLASNDSLHEAPPLNSAEDNG